jgi:hypothetical protein
MCEYFPTNDMWSLCAGARLNSGGAIDEEDRACRRPIQQAAEVGETA